MNPRGLTASALLELAALDKVDWEQTLQHILRVDAHVLEVGRVSYWSLSGGDLGVGRCELGFLSRDQSYERGAEITRAEYPRYFAELTRAVLIDVDDARSDERTSELGPYLVRRNITAMLDVPVYVRGQLSGIVCHEQVGTPRKWDDEDRQFALAVAQVVSTTLESRHRTLAEGERRRAQYLSEATRAFAETLDFETVAQRVVSLAITNFTAGSVLDLLEDNQLRRVATAYGPDEGRATFEELARNFQQSGDLTHYVLRTGNSVFLPSLTPAQLEAYGVPEYPRRLIHELGAQGVIAVPVRARGNLLGVLSLFATRRRLSPEDVHLAEDLADRAGVALDNAALFRSAREAVRARDEFLSLASHELRTPITALRLMAQTLIERVSADEGWARHSLELVVRQSYRLQRLIDLMLDSSRIQLGQLSLQRTPTDLVEVLREVLDSMQPTIDNNGCQLTFVHPEHVRGLWDGTRLEQVVSNLLDNAVKFGAGKPVRVSVGVEDGRAVLRIRDFGIGIEPERLVQVFNRFARVVSMRNYGGLGLGLYLARGLVEAHGGNITLRSDLGDGTEVTVSLPGLLDVTAPTATVSDAWGPGLTH